MADDDTISYHDSEDSSSNQGSSQDSGQGSSQKAGQSAPQGGGVGGSASQGSGPSQSSSGDASSSQNTSSSGSPSQGSSSGRASGSSSSTSSANGSSSGSGYGQGEPTEEEGGVVADKPVPDESNLVKPKASEAVSEAAESAYGRAVELGEKGAEKASNMKIVAAAAIIIVIIVAAFLFFRGNINTNNSTITYTTTVKQNYQLSSCGVISSPGSYTVQSSILTKISSGACIVVKSGNVKLTGSNVQLTGSGPFVNKPPFTYGILVENATNISIQGFNVTRFSYGIYLENASHVSLKNSVVGNSTMSDISISNAPFTAVSNDIVFGASDPSGAILIGTGSNGTAITNSIIEFNAYYGTATYSTNTVFYGDTFLGNQVDMYCGAGAPAYKSSGSYSNSVCSVNKQCNFATCTRSNYDYSLASYNLSSQVSTCGALASPGTYTLDSNLDLAHYINVSRGGGACLTVTSPGVKLNCNGKSIINSYYGVYGSKIFNFSIQDCSFSNDTYGAYFNDSALLKFRNVSYTSGTYGIYLNNDSFANITDSRYTNNVYGLYLGNSSASVSGIVAEDNTYGFATNGSATGTLYNGTVLRNKVDLYCGANSYNKTGITASGVSCSTSDCNWAAGLCTTKVLPPLAAYPINSCTTLSVPGNYSLNTNLIPKTTCMTFAASNVKLNCNGHLLNYDGSSQTASAFYASGVSNITLIGCNTDNFPYGFSAYNSSRIVVGSSTFSQAHTAVNLYNVTSSVFRDISNYNYSDYGIHADRLMQSFVLNNLAYSLSNNATGFALIGNSTRNTFMNNTASNNKNTGFVFDSSDNNLVANNTASSNANDYACNSASSGIYAELNGINHGLTKTGCTWLVDLPPSALAPSCTAINTVNGYHISYDMLYTYGTTCFSIYNSNKTTLTDGSYVNCEGHTIYALHGGIFADIYNTSSIKIENCYLKNFTQAVVSSAKATSVLNSTIANSVNGIVLNGANGLTINDVSIFNATDYGIYLNSSSNDAISNLNIRNSTTGMHFNATFSTLGGSSVYGSAFGIYCPDSASNGNRDMGSNSCSTTNCSWLTSTACKA